MQADGARGSANARLDFGKGALGKKAKVTWTYVSGIQSKMIGSSNRSQTSDTAGQSKNGQTSQRRLRKVTSDAGPYRVPRLERSENTEREDTMHLYLYGRRWQSSRSRLESASRALGCRVGGPGELLLSR